MNCEPTYEELKPNYRSEIVLKVGNCEPTYEELKLVQAYYFWDATTQLRAYLWGIETTQIHPLRPRPIWIASLPMRNWNSSCSFILASTAWNCEPTYEELKPMSSSGNMTALAYCEPTYEELKRICLVTVSQITSIASLPMRNWNYVKYFFDIDTLRLRAYLWGIETTLAIGNDSEGYELRAYLWGIETIQEVCCGGVCWALRAYLWGIETMLWTFSNLHNPDCEPTYEELKPIGSG